MRTNQPQTRHVLPSKYSTKYLSLAVGVLSLGSVPLWAQDAPPITSSAPASTSEVSPGTSASGASGSGTSPATEAGQAALDAVVNPELSTGLLPANPLATPPPPPDPEPGLGDARLEEAEGAPVLGVIEAIALALRDNPSRKEARFALEAARQRIGTARSAGGPQVNASADGSLQRGFGGSGGGGTGTGNNGGNGNGGNGNGGNGNGGTDNGNSGGQTFLGFNDSVSAGLNASVPLYTGGRVKASTRVAEANARAQAARVLQVDQELVLQVSLGYLDVLRSDQLLRVANSNLGVSRERRRVAGVRFDAGAAARLEVLRADTTLADAQQRRVAAVNSLAQSKAALNTLLGRAPETPLRTQSLASLAVQFGGSLPPGAFGLSGTEVSPSSIAGLPVPDASPSIAGSSPVSPGLNSTTANPATSNPTINVPGATIPGATIPNVTTPGATGATGNTGTGTSGTGATAPNVSSPGSTVPGAVGGNTGAGGTGIGTSPSTGSTGTGVGATAPGVSVPGVTAPGAGGAGVGGTGSTTSSGTVLTNPAGTSGTAGTTGAAGTGEGTGGRVNLSQQAANLAGQGGVALRASAGSSRQSLAVTQAQIEAALAAVDVARAQKKPNVDLNVSGFLRNPASFLGRFILGIGLGIAQNIYDSGRTRSQVREAQATVEQLRQGFAGQQLQVAQQIEQSLLALDSAQRRQNSADVAVRASAEALRAAQLGFEAGATTNLEVTDAQTALLAAQIDSINTRFDVTQAQATLSATVGVLSPEARAAFQIAVEEEARRINASPIGGVQPEPPKKKRRKFLGIF